MARTSRSKTSATKPELEVVSSDTIVMPAAPTPVSDQENSPPPVGEQLRRERERRGISIEAVAQMLKIRRVYLKAIEESNWAELPEPVYVNGFIRSYANFLGLNVLHAIPSGKTEIINLPSLPKLEIPKPIDDQQLPSITTIIFAALGLFFLYAIWVAVHSDGDKSAAPTTPTVTEQSTADAAAPTPTPTLLNEPALVQSSDNALPTPAATPTPAPAPIAAKPAAPAAMVYGAATPTRATITATQDSWIQIQTQSKQVVFSSVLRAGDSYRVPDDAGLMLTTTNLSGLKFTLDGANAQPPSDTQNSIDQALSLAPDHFLKPPATTMAPASPPVAATQKSNSIAPKPTAKTTAAPRGPHYTPQEMEDSTSDSEYPDDSQ